MILTTKQKNIIHTLWLGEERGNPLDLDELLELLPYTTTKASMQFSLRALINKGLVTKGVRRQREAGFGQYLRELKLTTLGRAMAKHTRTL